MVKKLKKARVAQGYYGNEPVKEAEGTGPLLVAKQSMGAAKPLPCVECPLRRDCAPGYLGGYTPAMYLDVMHGPASIACHRSPGFHAPKDITKQHHCTGVAAYRANVGIIASVRHNDGSVTPSNAHTSTQLIGSDAENYFTSPQEFYDHHSKGQKANGSGEG